MKSEATRLQDRIIDGVNDSLDGSKDAFIYGPTGCGKTRMFSRTAEKRAEKGERVLVLANRKNLVRQSQKAFGKWSDRAFDTSYGMDGVLDQSGQIVYSTVQTAHGLINELDKYDTVILDEAHHAKEDNVEYTELRDALEKRNPDIKMVAASATPPENYEGLWPRLQNADKHIITFEEAVAAKLVDLPQTMTPRMRYKNHGSVEDVVSNHKKSKTSAELESGISKDLGAMREDDWAEQLVNLYERHLAGQKSLGFFDSIKEAEAFVAEGAERNLQFEIVHSRRRDSQQVIEDFRNAKQGMLVSVDMISEGVDLDATGILLDKKTTSATEYKQIVGRGSRGHGVDKAEKTLLIDTGASTHIHGEIGAQATMQTLRGQIERKSMSADELLPDTGKEGFRPWIEVKVPDTGRSVWGTSVDGAIVYAAPTPTGYAAFQSVKDRKGSRIDLLAIEGERKGMPRREALGGWISDAVKRNERDFARLIGRGKEGITNLSRMISDDWAKNSGSIERSISMLTAYPAVARSQLSSQSM